MDLQETKKKVNKKNCIVEIFGIGYVGFPLSVRLASSGFSVIGIDTNEVRLNGLKMTNLKDSELILEKKFSELRKNETISLSKFSCKSNFPRIGIICVPTPISDNSINSNHYVISAVENFLACSKKGDLLFVESSIELGTMETINSIIQSKGFRIGEDFGLAYCPERIDPLNKKWELQNIARIIYCTDETTYEISKLIYQNVNQANLVRVSSDKVAEVVKSFENTFRLVNISLVNELAILCDRIGISVSEVLEAASTKPFGFIPFYTGAGAGGHCIPKDPIFLLNSAKKFGFDFSMVRIALEINEFVSEYIVGQVEKILTEKRLPKSVLVVGLTYKADLEDMRNSPGFKIIDKLNKKSFKVFAYDPFFNPEMVSEYLIQNNKNNKVFVLDNLKDLQNLKPSCLIIVQHHNTNKQLIQEIYSNSIVPIIYDCQCKLIKDNKSSTALKSFGG